MASSCLRSATVCAPAFQTRNFNADVALAANGLSALADKKPPKSLNSKEREVYGKQTAFFKRAAGQLRGLAARAEALLAKSKSQKDETYITSLQKMNLEFVAIQDTLQDESGKIADDLERFATPVRLTYALDPSAGGAVSYRHDDPQSITIRFAGVPVWGGGGGVTASAKLVSTGAITLGYESASLPSAIVGVSKGGSGNYTAAMSLATLVGSTWSYGSAGSVHASYASYDPFGLAGKSASFSP